MLKRKTTTIPICSQLTTEHKYSSPRQLKDSLLTLRYIYRTTNNLGLTYLNLYTFLFLADWFNGNDDIYREQIMPYLRYMGMDDKFWQWWVNNSYLVLDRIEKGKKIFKPTQKLYELMSRLNETLKEVK